MLRLAAIVLCTYGVQGSGLKGQDREICLVSEADSQQSGRVASGGAARQRMFAQHETVFYSCAEYAQCLARRSWEGGSVVPRCRWSSLKGCYTCRCGQRMGLCAKAGTYDCRDVGVMFRGIGERASTS